MLRAFAVSALVLAACTGNSSPTTDAAPEPAPSTSEPALTVAASSTTTLGPLDVAVPDISAYSYELTASTGIDVDEGTADVTVMVAGDYLAPDSHRFVRTIGFAGLETTVGEAIVIGDQAWIRSGEAWTETVAAAPSVADVAGPISSLASNVLPAPELLEQLYGSPGQREQIEGVVARRHDLDTATVGALADVAGEEFFATDLAELSDFSMTVWVAEADGAPLRWRIQMSGPVELLSSDVTLDLPPDSSVEVQVNVDFTEGPVTIDPPV